MTSQKARREYTSKVVNEIGECEDVKTRHPNHFFYFCELFKGHPKYQEKTAGMVNIAVRRNPTYRRLELYILYENGYCNVISYTACITGISKDKNSLNIAMRHSVDPQINTFKIKKMMTGQLYCELCDSTENPHVDHHSEKTPFKKLYLDFIDGVNITIPTKFNKTEGNLRCFMPYNSDFENAWTKYHEENAILRILCGSCNQKQKKYKPA
jgi:hypothetical protein